MTIFEVYRLVFACFGTRNLTVFLQSRLTFSSSTKLFTGMNDTGELCLSQNDSPGNRSMLIGSGAVGACFALCDRRVRKDCLDS